MTSSLSNLTMIRRGLLVANVVAALVIVAATGYVTLQDRRNVVADATVDAEILRDAVAEHTRQTFNSLALALRGAAELIDTENMDDPSVHEILKVRQSVMTFTFSMFVIDENAQLVASSRTPDPAKMEYWQDPSFLMHKDNPSEALMIAPPRFGRRDPALDSLLIPVSVRLNHDDGRFAGIVVAVISLSSLVEFYDTLRSGEFGSIGLLRRDTMVLAISPFNPAFIGERIAGSGFMQGVMPSSPVGTVRSAQNPDGRERIYAYGALPDYPIGVFVGISVDDRLAAWRVRLGFDIGIVLLSLLTIAVLSVLLLRRVQTGVADQGRRIAQLQILTQTSKALLQSDTVEGALQVAVDAARKLVPCHMAVISVTNHPTITKDIDVISLSERYAKWRGYLSSPDGSGIYSQIAQTNRPMRLTQAELLAHPAWRGFGTQAAQHPPLNGWLAVPLFDPTGRNLGLIQLSDRVEGDFSAVDETFLLELSQRLGAMIHLLKLSEDLRLSLDRSNSLRSAAEAARLAEAEARHDIETILTSIRDGMVAIDENWRFTFVNPRGEELLERSAKDLIGRNVWAEFPELVGSAFETGCERAVAEQVSVSFVLRNPRLQRWFDFRAFPKAGGGVTVYFVDVTEARFREEQLRQSQKMEAVGQLTGGLAHDFNNLLTVILGNTETLLSVTKPQDRPYPMIKLIETAALRAKSVTERLLAFARRQPLAPRFIDTHELIRELEPLLASLAGPRARLRIEKHAETPWIMVDPVQLQNALINLVANARDAMPKGGEVTIRTDNALKTGLTTTDELPPGRYVTITVKDTGTGMAPAVLARVLEPFFTTKGSGEGTGLGLSTVYGFVRQSGGDLAVASEPGKGTTVTLSFPVQEPITDGQGARP